MVHAFFNAVTALDCKPEELANCADSVSICLSKGLGTPLGTVLVGSSKFIRKARRNRKILGGSMRQVGVVAAAGHYALDNNISRLEEDHKRAEYFANELRGMNIGNVDNGTNMVFFTPIDGQTEKLRSHLEKYSVKIGDQNPSIRMVLHRDISDESLEKAITGFKAYYQ